MDISHFNFPFNLLGYIKNPAHFSYQIFVAIVLIYCLYFMLQKSILRKFYFFVTPQISLSSLLMSSSLQYPRPGQKYARPKALLRKTSVFQLSGLDAQGWIAKWRG